jgi:hypothetical protein
MESESSIIVVKDRHSINSLHGEYKNIILSWVHEGMEGGRKGGLHGQETLAAFYPKVIMDKGVISDSSHDAQVSLERQFDPANSRFNYNVNFSSNLSYPTLSGICENHRSYIDTVIGADFIEYNRTIDNKTFFFMHKLIYAFLFYKNLKDNLSVSVNVDIKENRFLPRRMFSIPDHEYLSVSNNTPYHALDEALPMLPKAQQVFEKLAKVELPVDAILMLTEVANGQNAKYRGMPLEEAVKLFGKTL